MKDSTKIKALRKLLVLDEVGEHEIEAILAINRDKELSESMDSLRSWVSLIISGVALVVSILVAIFK